MMQLANVAGDEHTGAAQRENQTWSQPIIFLLRVGGLEGGALLALSAVRPSQLPAALWHGVAWWPPNNCRLSRLWALSPQ